MPDQVTLLIGDSPTIVRMEESSIVFQIQAVNATPLTITNYFVYAGNTVTFHWQVFESDGVTPLSIDNCAINFYALHTPESYSADYIFYKTSAGSDVVITNALGGQANLYIRPTDTQNMVSGISFYCFVQLLPPNGNVYTLSEFLVTIR